MTSRTSAPTASHRPATALTKLSLVARKALEAYLIVSAVAASVISSGAWVPANRSPTLAAAAWSSAPTTMRSGSQAVGHGRPLPEELGIGHHGEVVAAEDPLDHQRRSHRHGRLVDDDRARAAAWARSPRPPPRRRRGRPTRRHPGVWARRGRRTRLPPPPRWLRPRTGAGRPPGPRAPAPRDGPRRWAPGPGSASPPWPDWCRHRSPGGRDGPGWPRSGAPRSRPR